MAVRLNEDREIVEKIREGLRQKDGYCPCKVGKLPENKCMCEEFKEQIADPDFEATVTVCCIISQRIDAACRIRAGMTENSSFSHIKRYKKFT